MSNQHTFKVLDVDNAIPRILRELAESAGIGFDGKNPWDIVINNPEMYAHVISNGSLGLGEAYMDGHWSCDRLDEFFSRLLFLDLDRQLQSLAPLQHFVEAVKHKLLNLQSKKRATQVALAHYDAGNDVFEAMLDPTMSYSCGYWVKADTLDQAQIAKLDLICRKLELAPGEKLLDIGCGWGGLAEFAASKYKAHVTGVTVSREQQRYAEEKCRNLPVEIKLMDYRDITGSYDKIVSVGMFEHVGPKNYRSYFGIADKLLSSDGLFLLHTIGTQESLRHTDPWIDRYIFPNGRIPLANEITRSSEDVLIVEDWHNFGTDYDKTLMAWSERFDAAWVRLSKKYDERFYRMWHYYLMSCAAFFRSRQGQLWQIVFSKRQRAKIYRSVR